MTTRQLLAVATGVAAICGAIEGVVKVEQLITDRLDARYASRGAFERFTHDDTLRHVYADKQRARTAFLIDSIEQAHQRPRVLQAGNPR